MTEVDSKANVLRQNFYPMIRDNTLSLFIPLGSDEVTTTNDKLVPINQLQESISPLNSLLEACNSYPDVLVENHILVGTIRHRVDNSHWFVAQASFDIDQPSFHIDQAVKREDTVEGGDSE
ncbi:MAG: hypothetical protein F4227_04790 [Gammaproteobacteria bacterium]|nr:hypothetical protein [Gammaproteobacteria bacterium]MYF02286.1 hypothetical protein [Gammaproteobacteria bacterium]MYI76358.1 hypothetical protein [Gammaproteobacteria bacterium]